MALTKVSTPAIKDEAITLAKLLHGDSNSNGKFLRANNGADPTFEDVAAASGASGAIQINDGSNGFTAVNTHSINQDTLFSHDIVLNRDSSNGEPTITPGSLANITLRTCTSASGAFGSILNNSGLQLGRNTQYVKLKALSDQVGQQSYDFAFPINAGSNGQALITDGSGNTSWSTISSDLVADTSPQLGGNLDCNGNNISLDNNNQINLGNDNDLIIKVTDTNSTITHNGEGNLYISAEGANEDVLIYAADDILLRPQGGEDGIKVIGNGAVELYYDGNKRLYTTNVGVDVQAEGSAVELRLKTDGGTLRGYVYGNNSNEFGFLSSSGYWPFKHSLNSKSEFFIGNTKKATVDGDGIKFNSDTSSNNALDDYEEGTFTLVISDATSGGNSASGVVKQGKYTKIGSTVTVMINASGLSNGGMNGSHQMFITNLPFRMKGVNQTAVFTQLRYFNNISNTQFGTHWQINQNETIMRLKKLADNAGEPPNITFNHWMYSSSYFAFACTFSYITDQ